MTFEGVSAHFLLYSDPNRSTRSRTAVAFASDGAFVNGDPLMRRHFWLGGVCIQRILWFRALLVLKRIWKSGAVSFV
jgi:hypothetical protein